MSAKKYVFLTPYESMAEAKEALNEYFEYYNCERCHEGLERKTPYEIYWGYVPEQSAAALTISLT